ncbi:hypothetical protein PF005_g19907 [Phytophthora fragariae]|uniref:Uncharacterized protein n=2 Tax=Phytophthora TaxID=4783 RepID=A0A6A3XKH3_9STRA|nr:hypothetical protein PF003_g22823 [Phytophthora fragariae]KAE8996125.1 hypothetical protein PR001_g19944 [Phytophthora rubi]KAE8928910.1 hypothetical protein PF009_g20963 [Phytophthora fragariae]KAE8987508.1 hypothetical protein PF011_g19553 [Phytophthora fragariae]KAE9040212.1 hypothetical protein PR002_g5078 [Phytophthora rubi]
MQPLPAKVLGAAVPVSSTLSAVLRNVMAGHCPVDSNCYGLPDVGTEPVSSIQPNLRSRLCYVSLLSSSPLHPSQSN